MPEIASVICLGKEVADIVNRAVVVLNRAQGSFDFRIAPNPLQLPSPDLSAGYSWDLLGSMLAQEKQGIKAKYLFGVLDQPIEYNWFSRTLHDERICFITTKDWEYLSQIPLAAFVAYEIAENLVEMLIEDINAHEDETRGCLFDMCALKPHISFKMRTADICAECMDILNQKLQPSVIQAVVAMLEEIRGVALGRAELHSRSPESLSLAETVDREFPFPLAYCFRSMQTELTYSRKWLKALELYEVIIKYVTFVLLSALHECEQRFPSARITNLRRPSVGHWHAACFSLLKLAQDPPSRCFISRQLAELDRTLIRRAHAASERLMPLRNDTRGHGFVEEEAMYQALYEENLGEIQTLIEFVAPLSKYSLIKVGDGLRRRRGISTFPAKILMGSHPIFPVRQYETQEEVDTDCLLHDPEEGKYLSLYPWLVMDNCRACHREVVFLYDKLEADHVVMREYPTNHKQQRNDLCEVVQPFLNL